MKLKWQILIFAMIWYGSSVMWIVNQNNWFLPLVIICGFLFGWKVGDVKD